ncbi:MAG: DUF2079 domain-containing protein [Clostridia bacterium]|nr:DUF2079 domain-containing protein [Clostridia bacterium]
MKTEKRNDWRVTQTAERVICRLLAAWCAFAAILALSGDGFFRITFAKDVSLLWTILCILLFFTLLTGLSLLLRRYPTDAFFLLFFSTVCVFRWLLTYEGKNSEQNLLFCLGVTVVYSLFVIYAMKSLLPLLGALPVGTRTVVTVVGVGAFVAFVILSAISCLRYKTFSTPNFDFGIFTNMFHNMRKTGLPLVTCERDALLSHFAVHISPIYYLLLPFYWIFPSPLTLQIGQAAVLALGVIPVVLLARHYRLSPKMQILIALLYSFYPVLSTGCFYDIHENCFLPLCLLWTFYFFEKEKPIPMYIAAVCVLAVKEDAAIYLLIFAVYAILGRRKYLHGTVLAVLSAAYFLLATHLINTVGDGVLNNRFDNLIAPGEEGLGGILQLAVTNPGYLLTQLFTEKDGGWGKIAYLLQMLLPLAGLPLLTRKPSRWILLSPLLISLLSHYVYLYDVGFQYHFGTLAFLFYAAIGNLPSLKRPEKHTLLTLAAVGCCCLYLTAVLPKLSGYWARWEQNRETYVRMEEILGELPEDASLNVSSFLLAHVADRDEVYEVRYHQNKPDVDFVVLDIRSDAQSKVVNAYLREGYTVYAEHEGLILILARGK